MAGYRYEERRQISQSPEKRIVKRVWIRASPEVVYKALTNPKDLRHWFCDGAISNPREGGELSVQWKTGKTIRRGRAVFVRIIPDSMIELLWKDEGRGEAGGNYRHTLSYEIRARAGMTEVIMIDEDDRTSDEVEYDFLDQGWNTVLLELKDHCERRERTARLRSNSKPRA